MAETGRTGRPRGLPLVALVGRPNVGKSSLFNRFVGDRMAVVEEAPGTTRDRVYGELEWRGRGFAVVDTAGIAWRDPAPVAAAAERQAELAAREADLVVVVVDGTVGPTDLDLTVARRVLRSGRPHVLLVNKVDDQRQHIDLSEFYALGLGDPLPISALHGTASGDVLDAILERLPDIAYQPDDIVRPQIAIVGRPNVGKSSLVNAILGHERVVVHEAPGTTRDSVDTLVTNAGQELWLIDTAGLRRRGHIEPGVEQHSVLRALRSIQRCDVGVLMIDAAEGPTEQDAHVAGFLLEAHKGIVLALNKWDLLEGGEAPVRALDLAVARVLQFLPNSPVVRISALTGRSVAEVLPAALAVYQARQTRIPARRLNTLVRTWVARRDPPSRKGRTARFKYVTQVGVNPPEFVFLYAHPELVHPTYRRFLENGLRAEYPFAGTPLVIHLRAA